jgi:hypothetical protein
MDLSHAWLKNEIAALRSSKWIVVGDLSIGCHHPAGYPFAMTEKYSFKTGAFRSIVHSNHEYIIDLNTPYDAV